MNKIVFEKEREEIFFEDIDGFKVILYPTNKSKNFYITLTSNFGAKVTSYKKNNKTYNVIPGTAHFLEHKVMNLNDKKIASVLEKLGTMPNAYTNYYGTTYNLYGSVDIIENLKLLFERVFTFSLTDKSVKNEIDIISEEIDMYIDNPNFILINKLNNNLFHNEYIKNKVLGEKDTIKNITKEYLYEIYDTFYIPSNMFLVVTGTFDKDEVMSAVKEELKKIKNPKKDYEIMCVKEPKEVLFNYEEYNIDLNESKVGIAYKIDIKSFKEKNIRKIEDYLYFYLNILFSSTSEFLEKLKKEGIITGNIGYSRNRINDYIVIKIISNKCNDKNRFINEVREYLKNNKLSKEDFNRKKKVFLSSLILLYDDIEYLNESLISEMLEYNEIDNNAYKEISSYTFEEFVKITKLINYDNESILVLEK